MKTRACVMVFAVAASVGIAALSCTPGGSTGGLNGTLSGVVTNSATAAPVAGAQIALLPAIEGVTLTSGTDGAFSATLPLGVYSLTISADGYTDLTAVASVLAGQTATVNAELAPTASVVVEAAAEGDAAPGATLNLSATALALDGSTVQSVT